MKACSFTMNPLLHIPPPSVVEVGDAIPNLHLVSLAGKIMRIADLHVNKNRPMMIMASSAS